MQRLDRASLERSVALLHQAMRCDPAYARALAELARAYTYQAHAGYGEREPLMRAGRQAAERALALDSTLPDAHASLGSIAFREDWDFPAAEAHWRRAIALNPGLARAHSALAWLLVISGRTAEAIDEGRHAVTLDPVSGAMLMNLAGVYNYARQCDRSLEAFESALQLDPRNATFLNNEALTYAFTGQNPEAIRTAERGRDGSSFSSAVLAFVYGRAGRRAEALQALRSLEALPHAGAYLLATAYAGLGDREHVFAQLERAVADRDSPATDLAVDPAFDSVRTDPRMRQLVQRLGLSYWMAGTSGGRGSERSHAWARLNAGSTPTGRQ